MKPILLICCICFYAYGFSQNDDNAIKALLDSISQQHIQYFANGQVEEHFEIFSNNYTDIGGGPNGDGSVNMDDWKRKFINLTSSDDFKHYKGKSPQALLQIDKKTILNYDEIVKEKGIIKPHGFVLTPGDYVVVYPKKKDSPLDGWFGIFRLKNEVWKIVAGD